MSLTLHLTAKVIDQLDLSPGRQLVEAIMVNPQAAQQSVTCSIDYPRALDDPREVSELPDVRLWFVRFDAEYPWFPFFLDWRQGELARYTAMLVPHQFHPHEGIQYHEEALELFVYSKLFVLMRWLKHHQLGSTNDLRNMALVFGFEINDNFLELWERDH